MGTIDVRLFGAPEIRSDGRAVAVDTRKAIALLAILAVERRPMRRDTLAALLWPDASQERARGSLRRTLSSLRSAIGADGLTADREVVALQLAPHSIDVLNFDELCATSPSDALAVYRGPFLEGFSLADSADFDNWQRGERERFQVRADGLLDGLIDGSSPSMAAGLARRRLELDPMNEAACRQAMSALGAVGDRSGAISVYRALVRDLDDELGVEPLVETTALYEAVRRGERSSPRIPLSLPVKAPAVARSSLIGRADDIEALTAAAADCSLVVVAGEPGIGRTRLVEDWAARLEQVLVLRCHVGEQNLPYAPFSRWIGGSANPSQIQLFEELAAALPLDSGGVLVIDDLHRADSGTMAFLTYVVHRHDRFEWPIVGTWRGDAVRPGDGGWDLLTEGRREGWATELRLSRLATDEMADLVDASGAWAHEQIQEIVDFAEGLPLLAVELMHLGPDSDSIPQIVDDLMRTRLGSVSPLARQVVEALAVIDRPAEEGLVQSVAGRSRVEISVAIEELAAADIARTNGTVELTHHLLGVVALAELSTSRVRVLHERAGAVLPTAEAAGHVANAGHQAQAADLHITAAKEARQAHALGSALHHLHAALALGRADDAVLQRRIGDIETMQGRYDPARRAYEISAARSLGADLVLVELQLARLALRCGDSELAASHLDSADAELSGSVDGQSPQLAAELAITRALAHSADKSLGADAAHRAIELARRLDDPAVEAAAESAAALGAYRRHDAGDAAGHAREALRLSQLGQSPSTEAAAANLLGLIQTDHAQHDDAIWYFETARTILGRHGDVHRLAAVHANLADAFHVAGRDDEARNNQLESTRLFSEVGGPPAAGRAEVWFLAAW